MKQLQALVLAAGKSQRFPTNKLLRPIPGQSCLLDVSYQLAHQLTPHVLLIINRDSQLQQHCHTQQYDYVINPQADSGMASSIACGVAARAQADGWAIFLADMPCIQTATLHTLAQHWQAHEVLQPIFQQQTGHPVIFAHRWYEKLISLRGDQGARELLRDNPQVFQLETQDAGICFDIDTEADWQAYLHLRQD